MDDCLFCRIASGDIPSDFVLEDADFVAFRDLHPKAAQHVLVVPREHIVSLNELGCLDPLEGSGFIDRPDLLDRRVGVDGQALLRFIVLVAKELGISESGYRALTNVGSDGGQEVQHLHFHILGGEDLGDIR